MSTAILERTTEQQQPARRFARPVGAERIEAVGQHAIRYGLVLVLLWIGGMKFTAYEAEGISGLVSNSPLMSWVYQVFSTRQFSLLLGAAELLIAALIAARPFSPGVSAVGSALAAGMFLTTLSFLGSTPGVVEPTLGFPTLSVLPGQFLIKDVVLLGASVWATGEALRAARRQTELTDSALKGYDPVAYFTEGNARRGRIEHASHYAGSRFYFSSDEHRQMFEKDPEQFLPQYAGYCAYGVAMGQLFDVDPRTGQVIDGKLYLNLNRKILAEFNQDTRSYIEQANESWPEVAPAIAA